MNGFSFESNWIIFISFLVCSEKNTCAYWWVGNIRFLKYLACFVFTSVLRFALLALLPTIFPIQLEITKKRIYNPVKPSVIRQKSESQNGCFKKTKQAKFSKKRTFFYPLIAKTAKTRLKPVNFFRKKLHH